ncbi:hypothetical protein ACFQZ4_11990 [Catellatospora coxensis]
MVKTVTAQVSLPDGLAGRAMTPVDFDQWLQEAIRMYAEEMTASGSRSPPTPWPRPSPSTRSCSRRACAAQGTPSGA